MQPLGGPKLAVTPHHDHWIGDAGIDCLYLINPADLGAFGGTETPSGANRTRQFGTVRDLLRDSFRWTRGWRTPDPSNPVDRWGLEGRMKPKP